MSVLKNLFAAQLKSGDNHVDAAVSLVLSEPNHKTAVYEVELFAIHAPTSQLPFAFEVIVKSCCQEKNLRRKTVLAERFALRLPRILDRVAQQPNLAPITDFLSACCQHEIFSRELITRLYEISGVAPRVVPSQQAASSLHEAERKRPAMTVLRTDAVKRRTVSQRNFFDLLSDELITYLLSYLAIFPSRLRLACTCRRLRSLAMHRRLNTLQHFGVGHHAHAAPMEKAHYRNLPQVTQHSTRVPFADQAACARILNSATVVKLVNRLINPEVVVAVDLSYCLQLSDASVLGVLTSCQRLRVLRLAGCMRLTDVSLKHVAQKSTMLDTLDVSFCPMVTDRALFELAQSAVLQCTLRQLVMQACDKITMTGVQKLCMSVHGLQCLNVQCCHFVLDEAYQLRSHSLECLNISCTCETIRCLPLSQGRFASLSNTVSRLRCLTLAGRVSFDPSPVNVHMTNQWFRLLTAKTPLSLVAETLQKLDSPPPLLAPASACVHCGLRGGGSMLVCNCIDWRQDRGSTILHAAVKRAPIEVLATLLSHPTIGALVNVHDVAGQTPLHYACTERHSIKLSMLLKAGARVDVCDVHGHSAITLAKDVVSVQHLVQSGAVAKSTAELTIQSLADLSGRMRNIRTKSSTQRHKLINASDLASVLRVLSESCVNVNHAQTAGRLLSEMCDDELWLLTVVSGARGEQRQLFASTLGNDSFFVTSLQWMPQDKRHRIMRVLTQADYGDVS